MALALQKHIPEQTFHLPIPKFWDFGFLSVNGNGKFVSAIMKNGKMAPTLHKCVLDFTSLMPVQLC